MPFWPSHVFGTSATHAELASRSIAAAVTIMVPISLAPAAQSTAALATAEAPSKMVVCLLAGPTNRETSDDGTPEIRFWFTERVSGVLLLRTQDADGAGR